MPVRPYDGRVTDTDQTGESGKPGEPAQPGERRLARPPSDRYRESEEALAAAAAGSVDAADPGASVARGVAVATAVAIAGAAAIVLLGGVLTLTEVLVVVAGFTGGGV